MKNLSLFCSICLLLLMVNCKPKISEKSQAIKELKTWIQSSKTSVKTIDDLTFFNTPLSKEEAQIATKLLFEKKQKETLDDFGKQWDERVIQINSLEMPIYYQTFGEAPEDGRSLFISMHGGGNAAAEVNDRQYKNQQHLYDAKMASMEGIYLAARAPTNTWNLWHEAHIDDFFNRIIQLAMIKENVNPNKVYITGYSAGGDGTYQLAPRMGDRWAAAGMMAGHPNETSPVGLRNTPFTIQMGALDAAYDRNKIATLWDKKLDSLQRLDPKGYQHLVTVHPGKGHWMGQQDSIALSWMAQYKRNPIPEKIIWKQDDRHHTSFFWLEVPKQHIETAGVIIAHYDKMNNELVIEQSYTNIFTILLNDEMLNLDQPITIKKNNTVLYEGIVTRTAATINHTLAEKGDINLSFPAQIKIINNEVVN